MKNVRNASRQFFFALTLVVAALATFQLQGTDAHAQSSYFTSQGCSGCHSAPAVATCNGCHAHGTHPNSAKSTINVAGATNKTSYAPGETVTVTITGGYRAGWIRAVLYDQNTVQLARSTGNASGVGSSTTYPAVLTAPAPVTPGSYTWKVAWYGNQYDSGTYGSGWTPDTTNPGHGYEIVSANSFTVAAPADTIAPVVTFTLPATATSLTVPVSSLTATDNVAVTGYLITTSATPPAASGAGWTASAPTSVTAVAGSNTFYAWAKDAAGNVSAIKSATVVVSLPAPAISLNPSFMNFSTVANTTATFTTQVQNTGNALLNITSIARCVGTSTAYAWTPSAPFSISAGGSQTIAVTYAPLVASTDTGCLQLFSNDPTTNPATLNLSGKAVFPMLPVRISGTVPTYFASLQSAYDVAPNGSVIQAKAVPLADNAIYFNRAVTVIMDGGYDGGYTGRLGFTTILGPFTIAKGKVSVKNFVIHPII